MRVEWERTCEAASALTNDHGERVRLADLAIAVSMADQAGLLGAKCGRRLLDGAALQCALPAVTLAGTIVAEGSLRRWDRLAERATTAAAAARVDGGLDTWVNASQAARAARKVRGAYATPQPLASELARSVIPRSALSEPPPRVIDPSAGYGSLLLEVLKRLGKRATAEDLRAIVYSLHGVELDPFARELSCLFLWLESARANPDLNRIAQNVVVDNAVTRDWWFGGGAPFDALVMNPPWESLRHDVSEIDPHPGARDAMLERLRQVCPGVPGLPPLFSLQGTGDRNLYKLFVELTPHLLRDGGRFSMLIPAAFASDKGMLELRRLYLEQTAISRWTSFENRLQLFPIDARYKFGILTGVRSATGTRKIGIRSFATQPSEVRRPHVRLSRVVRERLGGESQMIPEVTSQIEIETLTRAFSTGAPLFQSGPFQRVRYRREIDLTLNRTLFKRYEDVPQLAVQPGGEWIGIDGTPYVPLLEGRMIGQYDFLQKSWIAGSGRTAQWIRNGESTIENCQPQYVIEPCMKGTTRVALCDVTAATNTRTVHAAWVPPTWQCGNTAPVLVFDSYVLAMAGLAVLNSLIFDWVARRIVAGLHLNKFYLETLVWPRVDNHAIGTLAAAASFLSAATSPRFRAVGGAVLSRDVASIDYFSAHRTIECIVARGYGLTGAMLREIYSPDRTNRRGFWRFYDSDPRAWPIAQGVMESFADS